jgi:hypothetical protein
MGFANGSTEGYNAGYLEGHDSGYQSGYSEGYDNGYQLGYLEGWDLGYENGYAAGYENGLDMGRTHGYNTWDPTYAEMEDFIARDKTDENTYTENYTCVNFAADVVNNAKAENLRCAFVYLRFPGGAHSVVAFNTIDRGLIFIEPQTDEEMRVEVGKPYSDMGTVTSVIIVW